MQGDLVKCIKCGWVHFALTLERVIGDVERFNAYYDTLSPEKQQDYYGGTKSGIEDYTHCFRCGGSYKNFTDAEDRDCPMGSTIQPILARTETIP